MSPQSWVFTFNLISFVGASFVVISSIGAWYFGNKIDEEKDNRISELIEGKNTLLKQSKTAEAEATEIKRLNGLMLRAMENAGQVRLIQDTEGKITGFEIELAGSAKAEGKASGELSGTSKKIIDLGQ